MIKVSFLPSRRTGGLCTRSSTGVSTYDENVFGLTDFILLCQAPVSRGTEPSWTRWLVLGGGALKIYITEFPYSQQGEGEMGKKVAA